MTKNDLKIYFIFLILFAVSSYIFSSCISTRQASETAGSQKEITEEEKIAKKIAEGYYDTHFADGSPIVTRATEFANMDNLLITFAGDIMAHNSNWAKGNFNLIYEDIEEYLQESDFAFANLETPVCDDRPFSSYPNFNVHSTYAQAAIDAGFNVFSLANNHTNDQNLSGINNTKKYFDNKRTETADSERPVYAAGLKETANGPLSYEVIKKNGWTILYASITEILNTGAYSAYIDYFYPSKNQRNLLKDQIRQLREDHDCNMFVLGIHCGETEYILSIDEKWRSFYFELLELGVDVVWVNHPHVSKGWEVIADSEGIPRKMIFHSMGNTISGQRTNPSFTRPETNRDYTGEGYMTQVRFVKDEKGIRIASINPLILTTYITPEKMYVIKVLDDNFIEELIKNNIKSWPDYLKARKTLMEKIQGTTTIWE